MKEDIILAGVSLNELAETKKKIQQEAVKFVSDGIDEATKLVKQILDGYDEEEEKFESELDVDSIAKEAEVILDRVALVSGVSGVEYHLDWNTESYSEVLSSKFWNMSCNFSDAVSSLLGTLEDMESTVGQWENSNCY